MLNNFRSLPKLVIDLNAIKTNYDTCKKIIGNTELAAVVKANAYGLGLLEVCKTLETNSNCKSFFVANLPEGIEARKNLSKNSEIYIFHGLMADEEEFFEKYNLTPVINDFYQLELWQKYAVKKNIMLKCAIHFDTGMNRLGFATIDAQKIYKFIDTRYINVCLVLSHLAYAENKNSELNMLQLSKFKSCANYFPNTLLSLANSPSISLGNEYYFNMIRVGRALYGPNKYAALPEDLKPAVSIFAPILQIRDIYEDTPVGYAATHIAKKGSRLATLSIGYADGYMRLFGNISKVYYEGKYLPVVGKVSMDLITVDVTEIPEKFLEIGKFMEVIGKNIDFHDILVQSGTSSSELFSRLGNRFVKEYIRK